MGTTSLWAVARAAATLAPGLVLAGVGTAEGDFGVLGVGVIMAGYGVAQIPRAWRTRASDAVLTEERLSIEGGPLDGLTLAWSELDPEATRADTERKAGIRRLHLVTTKGARYVAAEAEHEDEQASLDDLLETIAERLGEAEPVEPTLPLEVVGCPSCGAPVRPSHRSEVACAFCGSQVEIGDDIRKRVQSEQQLSDSEAAIRGSVAALLEQPGATRANVVLGVLAGVASAVWVTLSLTLLRTGLAEAGAFEVGWALFAGALAVVSLFVFARAALVRRRALRLLATTFGARPPSRQGAAPGCRRCAAPLPEVSGVLARCVFCRADNVLGLDLRQAVAPARKHAKSLAEVIRERSGEKRRWLGLAGVVLPVAGLGLLMTVVSDQVSRELAATRAACAAEDAEACRSLAVDYDLGISVEEDEFEAFGLYRRACELGLAEACWDTAQALYYGWGTGDDPVAAEAFRGRACDGGVVEACSGF